MPDERSLDRFVEAQTLSYKVAIGEIQRGLKRTHWMWYIFPQIAGLGRSPTAEHFAIRSADEALAYLDDPLLGPRYMEAVAVLQDLPTSDAVAVFGETDAMKLKSSLTLFEAVRPNLLLAAAIDRWFHGQRDSATLALLGTSGGPPA